MSGKKFLKVCRQRIVKFVNDILSNPYNIEITKDDIYMVWYCKTLQNKKAIFSTLDFDNMFECTYNGDKKELYIDVYKKCDNITIKVE